MVKSAFTYMLPLLVLILFPVFISHGCNSDFEVLFDDGGRYPYRVFWCETNGSISKASTDGQHVKDILQTPGTPLDIILYIPGDRLYWTEYSYSSTSYQIRRSRFDGRDLELFTGYPADPFHGPTALTMDTVNGILYWNLTNTSSSNYTINYSGIDTLDVYQLTNTNSPYVYSISFDNVSSVLYFTANSYWDISTPAGSGNQGIAGMYDGGLSTPVSETCLLNPSTALKGIAVDSANGHMYYVLNTSTSGTISYAIIRASLTLQSPTTWITVTGSGVGRLALDLVKRKIYWTSNTDNSIYRANLDQPESGIEKFIQLASTPTGIAIAN